MKKNGDETKLKVALIEPPLIGHKFRGTGIYTDRLFNKLKREQQIIVSLVNCKANLAAFDIIHYPYFDPFFLTLPIFNQKRKVVTVHDLIPLVYPRFFPAGIKGGLKWQIQKLALSNSNAIITDSYASKRDIVRIAGIDEKKISVIYLGVGEEFKVIHSNNELKDTRRKLKLPQDFILYIGDVNYNKNIPNLIEVFKRALNSYPTLNLVFVGKGFVIPSKQLSELIGLINLYQLENKVYRFGSVELTDLVNIYNLAKVYLQLSFAEGFGLPVLEAMACGCPAIASNTSSLPEIVGRSGILVDPVNINDIVENLRNLLLKDSLRQRVIKSGLERTKSFSWNKCVNETIAVYKQILS